MNTIEKDARTGPLFDLMARAYAKAREYGEVSVEHLASESLEMSAGEFTESAVLMRAQAYDGLKPKCKRFLGQRRREEVKQQQCNGEGQLVLDGMTFPFLPLTMAVVRNEETLVISPLDATFEELQVEQSRERAEIATKEAAIEDRDRLARYKFSRPLVGDVRTMVQDDIDDDPASTSAA